MCQNFGIGRRCTEELRSFTFLKIQIHMFVLVKGGLPFWISRPCMHVHVCLCLYHISVRRNRDNLKRRLPNLRKYYMCVTWPRTFYFRHGFLPLSLCRTSCIIIMMMLNIINHQLPWRVSVMSESSKKSFALLFDLVIIHSRNLKYIVSCLIKRNTEIPNTFGRLHLRTNL